LTTRTSTGSKVDVFHQSQPLTQSSDVTHAVRVVKNVTCLSSLLSIICARIDIVHSAVHETTWPVSYKDIWEIQMVGEDWNGVV
jgi:hypothetical protein